MNSPFKPWIHNHGIWIMRPIIWLCSTIHNEWQFLVLARTIASTALKPQPHVFHIFQICKICEICYVCLIYHVCQACHVYHVYHVCHVYQNFHIFQYGLNPKPRAVQIYKTVFPALWRKIFSWTKGISPNSSSISQIDKQKWMAKRVAPYISNLNITWKTKRLASYIAQLPVKIVMGHQECGLHGTHLA